VCLFGSRLGMNIPEEIFGISGIPSKAM